MFRFLGIRDASLHANRLPLLLMVVTALILLAIGLTRVMAEDEKILTGNDPISSLPEDEQAEAQLEAIRGIKEAQPAFRDEWGKSGKDIHELPIMRISPQVSSTESLKEATVKAAAVIEVSVVSQEFSDLGVVSQVVVSDVYADKESSITSGQTISIQQPGGTFLNGDTPVLIEWESDPILWMNRSYVLFVQPCTTPSIPNTFCMPDAPGQIEVQGDTLRTTVEGRWTDQFNGQSPSDFKLMVASAR